MENLIFLSFPLILNFQMVEKSNLFVKSLKGLNFCFPLISSTVGDISPSVAAHSDILVEIISILKVNWLGFQWMYDEVLVQ